MVKVLLLMVVVWLAGKSDILKYDYEEIKEKAINKF